MATGDKSIQTVMEPERAALIRKIFCIVLAVFGAFTVFFGIRAVINAEPIVTAANEAFAAADKAVSFNAATVAVMGCVMALAGLCKVYVGVDSLIGNRQRMVNIVSIVNLVLVVVAFVAIYKVNGGFTAVMIIDLALSIVALCLLNAKLARYLREMFGELKKLTWLSGRDLLSHTIVVLTFVVFMAVLIWVLDLVFSTGFGALAKIKIG